MMVMSLYAGLCQAADVMISEKTIKAANTAKYYVIGIGINEYVDDFWPTLKWPVSDATKVIDHFGTDTQYEVEKILLTNQSATLNKVVAALKNVAAKADSADTVIVYVSGHGSLAQTADGDLQQVIVLHDTKKDNLLTTGLPHKLLYAWLDRIQARKKLVVLATCNSGEGKSRLPLNVALLIKSNKGDLLPLSEVSEGVVVLAAAAKGEAARENDSLQGDIYTHYLLEALSIYDRNKDGTVSALEAHDYARDRTWTFTQGQQRPTANAKLIGDADIPLHGRKSNKGLPVLEAYDESLAGFYLQINNRDKGQLPFAFPLEAGKSDISLYTPGGTKPFARYRVTASPGQYLDLDKVMNHRPLGFSGQIRQYTWFDNAWEKLSGSSEQASFALSGGYFLQNFSVGLSLEYPIEQSNTIQYPVESTVKVTSAMIVGGYRHEFKYVTVGAKLEVGSEKMEIDLRDKSTNESLSYDDDSFAYGGSLLLSHTIGADLTITLEAGKRWAYWDFGKIGDVDGSRSWFGVGMQYRFGSVARSLW